VYLRRIANNHNIFSGRQCNGNNHTVSLKLFWLAACVRSFLTQCQCWEFPNQSTTLLSMYGSTALLASPGQDRTEPSGDSGDGESRSRARRICGAADRSDRLICSPAAARRPVPDGTAAAAAARRAFVKYQAPFPCHQLQSCTRSSSRPDLWIDGWIHSYQLLQLAWCRHPKLLSVGRSFSNLAPPRSLRFHGVILGFTHMFVSCENVTAKPLEIDRWGRDLNIVDEHVW
jgi:hypothetical protein